MRPSRPRNDPFRRGDDRRRSASPGDDREQQDDRPPTSRYDPEDYGQSRSGDPRRSRRDASRAQGDRSGYVPDDSYPDDPGGSDPSDSAWRGRPTSAPRDAGRGGRDPRRQDDPYYPDPRDRGGRSSGGPASGRGRSESDRPRYEGRDATRSASRPEPQQRYGVISPSDDLTWPDAQPVDAEWQPAEPRPRRNASPSNPPAPRRRDPSARYGDERAANDRSYPPSQPTWSDTRSESEDPWPDDLDYGAYTGHDEPPIDDRGSSGYADDQGFEPEWPDDALAAEPADRNAAPPDWDQPEAQWDQPGSDQDVAGGWDDQYTPADASDRDVRPAGDDDPRAAVFGAPERPGRRSARSGDGVRPPVWGLSGYAWRFARRLTIPRANRLLRFGARRVLPAASQARFAEMRLPQAEVDETLGQIRSLDDWAEAWTGTAQRFLGETRRGGDMTPADAARSRQLAALCYHVAAFFAFGDERLARTSRSASTTLFTQSLGLLLPETRRVNVRWRSKTMPGYLTVPSWATGRRPLAVLMNGATTSREELILWSDEFLAQGLAVLALDTPGFGEASAFGPVSLDNDDIMDGIFELAETDPGLDPTRISLIGISLGGTMALRAAAQDRRVAAVVAVTPPYEPARWLGASSPVSLAQLVPLFGGYDQLADFVLGLDMPGTVAEVPAQVLVFGAGHDLVVPPPEASRLAAALGEQATLVWFDDAGHALFDVLPEWTREAAEWLAVVMDVGDAPIFTEQGQDEAPADQADGQAEGQPQPADDAGAATNANWRPTVDDAEPDPDPVATPSPTMGQRPAAPGNQPPVASHPTMARAPEPEPYGSDVFDAAQADARRAEQQRGYETGVFGPLGPAAARILADEPTPEPGSPEWGYDDRDRWTDDTVGTPFDDSPSRAGPSTSRLWQASEPAPNGASTRFRPVMARPTEPAGQQGPATPSAPEAEFQSPVADVPPAGYLSPSSPSVGRGRTSEPFRTVPPSETEPVDAAPPAPTSPTADTPSDAASSPTPNVADPALASQPVMDGSPAGPGAPAGEPDDGHAPFRPPIDRPE